MPVLGKAFYTDDAIDIYVEYDDTKISGLRQATPEEMAEATKKRRAVTDAYKNGQEEDVPATQEDYQKPVYTDDIRLPV